jgi:alkanesulfonate monooxygenase SsuD/methylene tetrahydromethanopterin reductase-like flavin-dependent oxidoreductase (luciferase family)
MAGYIVGDPGAVRAGIDELLEATAADELMVSTSAYHHAARRRSFELVAGLYV